MYERNEIVSIVRHNEYVLTPLGVLGEWDLTEVIIAFQNKRTC